MDTPWVRLLAVVAVVVTAGCAGVGPGGTAGTESVSTKTPTSSPTPLSDDRDAFTACQERAVLDDADPGRLDVYVEIDWVEGAKPDPEELARLVAVYDDAPIRNPGDERGIALHLVYDDALPARERPLALENVSQYEANHFDNEGRGYHYALFVEEVAGPPKGRGESGTMVVQTDNPEMDETGYVRIFAHELGHSLGLTREVHEGVDNRSVAYEAYPSVMSYAGIYEAKTLSLSNGSAGPRDFDDWSFVAAAGYRADTKRLPEVDEC